MTVVWIIWFRWARTRAVIFVSVFVSPPCTVIPCAVFAHTKCTHAHIYSARSRLAFDRLFIHFLHACTIYSCLLALHCAVFVICSCVSERVSVFFPILFNVCFLPVGHTRTCTQAAHRHAHTVLCKHSQHNGTHDTTQHNQQTEKKSLLHVHSICSCICMRMRVYFMWTCTCPRLCLVAGWRIDVVSLTLLCCWRALLMSLTLEFLRNCAITVIA